MEKLEVGEYIRTKDGIIAKITDIVKEYCIDCDNDVFDVGNSAMMEIPWEHIKEYIIKHSKNLIDLIEIGDIVNKGYIYEIGNAENGDRWIHNINGLLLYEKDIKTILTKEQYMQNCYKVEE